MLTWNKCELKTGHLNSLFLWMFSSKKIRPKAIICPSSLSLTVSDGYTSCPKNCRLWWQLSHVQHGIIKNIFFLESLHLQKSPQKGEEWWKNIHLMGNFFLSPLTSVNLQLHKDEHLTAFAPLSAVRHHSAAVFSLYLVTDESHLLMRNSGSAGFSKLQRYVIFFHLFFLFF